MDTVWLMYIGVVVFVFLIGLFGAYMSGREKKKKK